MDLIFFDALQHIQSLKSVRDSSNRSLVR